MPVAWYGPASKKNWTGYSQTFGNPIADYRINEMAFYVLDQWKVNSRFTVNLGVRWDKSLSMNFPVTNPDWPDTGYIHTPSDEFRSARRNDVPAQRQDRGARRIRACTMRACLGGLSTIFGPPTESIRSPTP